MRSPSQPYHRPPPGTPQCGLEVLLTYHTCDGREGKTNCADEASLSKAESTYMYRCISTFGPPPPPTPISLNLVKLLPSIGWILTLPKLHLAIYKTSSTILYNLYCMVLFFSAFYKREFGNQLWPLLGLNRLR